MIEEVILSFLAGCVLTFLLAREYFSEKVMKARVANTIEVVPTLNAIKRFRLMLPLLRTVVHDVNEVLEDLEESSEQMKDIEEDATSAGV